MITITITILILIVILYSAPAERVLSPTGT